MKKMKKNTADIKNKCPKCGAKMHDGIQILHTVGGYSCIENVLKQKLRKARRELAKANAVIKTLPKLADGTPVKDHQDVYAIIDNVTVKVHMRVSAVAYSGWQPKCPSTLKGSVTLYPVDCYSSKEAVVALAKVEK